MGGVGSMFFNDFTALPVEASLYKTVLTGYKTDIRQSCQNAEVRHTSRSPRYKTYKTYKTGGILNWIRSRVFNPICVLYVLYVLYTIYINDYSKLAKIYKTLLGLYKTHLGVYKTLFAPNRCARGSKTACRAAWMSTSIPWPLIATRGRLSMAE